MADQPPQEKTGGRYPTITLVAVTDGAIRWLHKAGTSVRRGDRIAEIASGGTTATVTAPDAGDLETKLVAEGARVEHGQAVAVLRQFPKMTRLARPFSRAPLQPG